MSRRSNTDDGLQTNRGRGWHALIPSMRPRSSPLAIVEGLDHLSVRSDRFSTLGAPVPAHDESDAEISRRKSSPSISKMPIVRRISTVPVAGTRCSYSPCRERDRHRAVRLASLGVRRVCTVTAGKNARLAVSLSGSDARRIPNLRRSPFDLMVNRADHTSWLGD